MAPKTKTALSDAYDAYVRLLERRYPDDPQGRTYREVIHDKLIEDARSGRKNAIEELRHWDRVFGPRPGSPSVENPE